MKKGYLIGGLAIVGTIALISLFKKPKRNSEGFFSMDGRTRQKLERGGRWCAKRQSDGSVTYDYSEVNPDCPKGWKQVRYFGDRTGI
jgi:hypothetical protein